MKNQNSFFLISFLPAIAYWYLEENYTLQVALIGGLLLAGLEITLEKIFTKHVHSISKFNFYLILSLGTIAFVGQEGIWFKLQPFFTGLLMGGYLIYRAKKNNSLMLETLKSMDRALPNENIIRFMERDLAVFLILYGLFMGYIAIFHTTSEWTFFKTIGFYICSFIFFIGEMFVAKKRATKC